MCQLQKRSVIMRLKSGVLYACINRGFRVKCTRPTACRERIEFGNNNIVYCKPVAAE